MKEEIKWISAKKFEKIVTPDVIVPETTVYNIDQLKDDRQFIANEIARMTNKLCELDTLIASAELKKPAIEEQINP
jgi:hypothetical protein